MLFCCCVNTSVISTKDISPLTGDKDRVVVPALDEGDLLHEVELGEAHAGPRVFAEAQLPLCVGAAHKYAPLV